MNARFSKIRNFDLCATDSSIGEVVDLLIDNEHWLARYLVVAIPNASSNRSTRVAIPSVKTLAADLRRGVISVSLDSQSIESSPAFDYVRLASSEHGFTLAEHYDWLIYWLANNTDIDMKKNGIPSLCSAADICGYQVRSKNGKAGMMDDLVINLENWSVSNGVAESSTWLPLESSMFSTSHIESVDSVNRAVSVDLSCETLFAKPVPSQFLHPDMQNNRNSTTIG